MSSTGYISISIIVINGISLEARTRILALVYSVNSIVPAPPNAKVDFQTNFPCLINLGQPLIHFKKPTKVFNYCACKHWT